MTACPETRSACPPYVGLRPFEFHESACSTAAASTSPRWSGPCVKGISWPLSVPAVRENRRWSAPDLLPAIAAGFMNGDEEGCRLAIRHHASGAGAVREPAARIVAATGPGPVARSRISWTSAARRSAAARAVWWKWSRIRCCRSPRDWSCWSISSRRFFAFWSVAARAGSDDGSSTADQRNAALAFVDLLLATAAERDRRVYVVLTMRSEYLGECEAFLGLSAAIAKSQFLTPRMTREQIQDIIERPLAAVGGRIEP